MVRNFWIDAEIDGRKTRLAGGPRAKDGSMTITLYQRYHGTPIKAIEIRSVPMSGEKLQSRVYINNRLGLVSTFDTDR